MVRDAARFLFECMRLFAKEQPSMFLASVAIALALGGLCWFACTRYTRLWNLHFHATATHHALCAFAALLTVVFVLVFAGLSQAKEVARRKIQVWHKAVIADNPFQQGLYRRAYADAKQAGLEKFDPEKHFPPGHQKSLIPLNHEETRIHTSKIYGDGACANFRDKHPFLSRVIWPSGEIPLDVISADMRNWFDTHPDGVYKLNRGIDLASEQIEKALEPNTPRVVSTARRYTTLLFLLVQGIPFALIGYAAYRDLKETT